LLLPPVATAVRGLFRGQIIDGVAYVVGGLIQLFAGLLGRTLIAVTAADRHCGQAHDSDQEQRHQFLLHNLFAISNGVRTIVALALMPD